MISIAEIFYDRLGPGLRDDVTTLPHYHGHTRSVLLNFEKFHGGLDVEQACGKRSVSLTLCITQDSVGWWGLWWCMMHDDVIKWKHFPRSWPFMRGIHLSPVNSPHKGQWRGAVMFSLICVWINDWVNNHDAGDLRRHRVHHDVTVMGGVIVARSKELWILFIYFFVLRFTYVGRLMTSFSQSSGIKCPQVWV